MKTWKSLSWMLKWHRPCEFKIFVCLFLPGVNNRNYSILELKAKASAYQMFQSILTWIILKLLLIFKLWCMVARSDSGCGSFIVACRIRLSRATFKLLTHAQGSHRCMHLLAVVLKMRAAWAQCNHEGTQCWLPAFIIYGIMWHSETFVPILGVRMASYYVWKKATRFSAILSL